MVRRTGLLKTLYLAFFSKPATDRIVYRTILATRANTAVELGVGTGRRSRRIIASLLRHHPHADTRYAGVDLFEARTEVTAGMTLKRAHQLLAEMGVPIRLIPGDPFSALARSANALTGTDIIVVGADQDCESLEDAWFYLPRMLHQQSIVLLEQADRQGYQTLTADEVRARAQASPASKHRAA